MPTRTVVACTSACALIAAGTITQTASADIVKAKTGEKSRLHVNKATTKQLKKQKTKITAIAPAKKSGSTISLAYDLARWDFTTHEGDVTHFTKHIGFRFQRGKRKVAMTHPRLTMDSPKTGYIEALISNVRIKIFNVRTKSIKVADTSTVQVITGYQLKLTTAGADYVNKALHHKSLKRGSIFGTFDLHLIRPAATGSTVPVGTAPGQGTNPGATATAEPGFISQLPGGSTIAPGGEPAASVDADGDGNPDVSIVTLPLSGGSFDVDTNSGEGQLDGALQINVPALGTSLTLDHPQVVIGATPDASGLFATVNGVRLKVGDIDTNNLDLDVANGTVNIHQLHVTVSGALAPILQGVLGNPLIQAGTPLVSLDLSLPQA
jgi:hypothetical protein